MTTMMIRLVSIRSTQEPGRLYNPYGWQWQEPNGCTSMAGGMIWGVSSPTDGMPDASILTWNNQNGWRMGYCVCVCACVYALCLYFTTSYYLKGWG